MLRQLWWIAGLLLIAGGAAIALAFRPEPADAGWFVYTPVTDASDWGTWWDDPGLGTSAWLVSRWQVAGCLVAVLGLVVVAAGIGFRMGRRPAAT